MAVEKIGTLNKHENPATNENEFDIENYLNENWDKIQETVDNNADELNTAKENIENLESGQGTASADITSLKNRVSTLETDNSTNKTNISNLEENKVDKIEGKGLSTEDFTTELKSKLESLEKYVDTEIKEDISNLEAEQIEQNEQIDILINALPSETQESENINIKGTIPTKFKEFKVCGNSKQETRSGKNMINVLKETLTTNGITFTNNKDGSVTINGTATGVAFFSMSEQCFTIESGKTYSLYLGGTTNGLNMAVRRESINEQLFILADGQESITQNYNRETVDDAFAYIRVETGTTLSNVTVYPTLVEGSEIGEWEPYGAMPSPEFISKIQNVEGDVNVTVANKEKTEQQTVTFPLSEGQKLMLGDHLAADGIHHKRTQIELPLVSKLQSTSIGGVNCQFASYLIADIKRENEMSNNFLCEKVSFSGNQFNKYKGYIIQKNFVVLTDLEDTVENINQLLAGTILEYELQNEIVEPYTEEQQEAYNQLKQLQAYEEETNIYSTNSTSPIFKVTAVQSTNAMLTQMKQLILEGGN